MSLATDAIFSTESTERRIPTGADVLIDCDHHRIDDAVIIHWRMDGGKTHTATVSKTFARTRQNDTAHRGRLARLRRDIHRERENISRWTSRTFGKPASKRAARRMQAVDRCASRSSSRSRTSNPPPVRTRGSRRCTVVKGPSSDDPGGEGEPARGGRHAQLVTRTAPTSGPSFNSSVRKIAVCQAVIA